MAELAVFNRLGTSLKRIDFVGGVHTVEPPEEIQPNTTLTWQSEDAGSVTYQVSSEGSERGAPRRFTLEWSFTASGAPTGRARNVDRGLKITVEQGSHGARFTVARKRARRIPPPAPRLARLPAVVGVIVAVALVAGGAAVLANPLKWTSPLPNHPTQGHASPPTQPRLAVIPTQTTVVACSVPSVTYPAITLSDTGGQPLTWNASATAAGASVSPTSGTLGAGQSATLQVEQAGPAKAATNIQITSNGGNATVPFICGPPTRGNLSVSPNALALGNYCGQAFSRVSIRLSDTGKGPLTWSKATGSGVSLSPASGTLNAGQSVSVGVSGTKANGSFGVAWQDGGTGTTYTVTVSTSCISTTPHGNLAVNPTSLALGNYCGQAFSGVRITLSNTGNGSLTWSQSGGSGLSLTPSSGQLNAGASLNVTLSGTKNNTSLNIAWQDGGKGNTNTVTVSLSCVAPYANLRVSQNQNYQSSCSTYTNTPPPAYAVTLDNTGSNVPVTWHVAWPIVNGSPFQWANTNPSGGTLAVGQTTSFQLTPIMGSSCPPPGNTWLMHYGLHLSFPQGGSQPDIGLTDNIMDPQLLPPNLTVNPTKVGLNGACGPSATVTLGNTGQQTLNWSSSTANGASVSPTSGSIAGGQTMQVTVTWTPIDPSSDGFVYITSNGGNGTIDINGPCPFIGRAIPSGQHDSGAVDIVTGERDVRLARVD